jgi:N-sulfoglucosamine sulfohydrolase
MNELIRAGRHFLAVLAAVSSSSIGVAQEPDDAQQRPQRPNILVMIAEDSSWLHYGAYGHHAASTPTFDRVAREGVLFTHAFCSEPTCSPSRAAIITGQQFWRLENASVFGGTLKSNFPVYPQLLKEAGYFIGSNGKAWGPGSWIDGGWKENPAGKRYQSFEEFLASVPAGKPFCFWQGSPDAHRPYNRELTLRAGKDPQDVRLPPFLPDRLEVRMDVLDYYSEIERFDRLVGRSLTLLEQSGIADNTILVVTSDHGMPFARGKANLYDLGTRVPLAIRWPSRVRAARKVDAFVSLTDLAPTFLEAAGLEVSPSMTGQSLYPLLLDRDDDAGDHERDKVFFGKEMGIGALYGENRLHGLPNRGVRTHQFLYILNYDLDSMPGYNAVQGGPATEIMRREKEQDAEIAHHYTLSYGKRPEEELYDCDQDPFQMNNLAGDESYADIKKRLRADLQRYLIATDDPRASGGNEVFMTYPIWYSRGKQPGQSLFLSRDRTGKLLLEPRTEVAN